MAQVHQLETEAFVIAAGQTVSAAVAIGNPAALGLLVPALTVGTLQIQVSGDQGATFSDLKDTTGAALLSYASGAGGFAVSSGDLDHALAYSHLRVVAGASQVSSRTFTLCRKILRNDPLA